MHSKISPSDPTPPVPDELPMWCEWLRILAHDNHTDLIGAALIGAARLRSNGNIRDWMPGGRVRRALDELLAKEAK